MEYKLEDVVEIYNKKRIPLSKMERDVQESRTYPYYGAQGIIDYVEDFIFDGKYLLIAEDGENLRSRNEDVARIVEGKFWVNNHAHILKSNNQANLYYLKDLINLKDLQPYLSGSVQPKLNLKSLKSIKVDLPNINVQNKIASFINRLDEKVTTNNKIIANLEELSQTLFKRWFIDFEFPNENGNPYKSSGGAFKKASIGDIPHSWSVEKLSSIAYEKKKKIKINENFHDYKYIGLEHMPRGSTSLLIHGKGEDVKGSKTLFETNDILFGKLRPNFKKVGLAPFDGVCSTDILVIKEYNYTYKEFLLNQLTKEEFHSFIVSTATGTRMPRTNINLIMDYEIAAPSKVLIEEFHNKTYQWYKMINSLLKENLILNELRDTLLPKLMSGELELPEELEV